MARGVNRVTLIGNVGQDPDVRTMPNGKEVVNFSVATSESWKDRNTGEKQERTEWHRCVAFDTLASIIAEYVRKGTSLYVEGKLQTRKWEKDGQTHYSTEIIVSEMQMLGSKQSGERGSAPAQQPNESRGHFGGQSVNNRAPSSTVDEGDFDDSIPF